eukprot:gene1091-1645_t
MHSTNVDAFACHAHHIYAGGSLPSAESTPLKLLTFDLDDTLWPTAAVVASANSALVQGLREVGAEAAEVSSIQDRIRTIRQASPTKLSYSNMRILAVESLLADVAPVEISSWAAVGNFSAADAVIAEDWVRSGSWEALRGKVAEGLFSVWLEERHAAAEASLFPGAAEALQHCRDDHPECIIGAVTNARGDPKCMPSLCELFDFTVSGEDPEVFPHAKPAPRIFEVALTKAEQLHMGCDFNSSSGGAPDTYRVHQGWVHVGDCLVNDVDASKAMGAKTVWLDFDSDEDASPSFSTASPEVVAERCAAAAAALSGGRVDKQIGDIRELPSALQDLCY